MSIKNELLTIQNELENVKDQIKPNSPGDIVLKGLKNGSLFDSTGAAFALQGLTLSNSDEFIGWVRSTLGSNSDLVKQINNVRSKFAESRFQKIPEPLTSRQINTALERLQLDRMRKKNPVTAIGSELAGNVGLQILGSRIPGLRTLLNPGSTMAQRLLQAGGVGTVEGFGGSETPITGPNTDILKTAVDTGVGALGGFAGGVFGEGLLKAGGAIRNLITRPGATKRGTAQGTQIVKQALEADQQTISNAAAKIADAQNMGKPFMPADVGEASRGVLDAARIVGGTQEKQRISQKMLERDQGAVGRATKDLREAFGNRVRFFPEFKALKAARGKRGDKMYTEAFKKDITVNDNLAKLFKFPQIKTALDKAYELAAGDGVELPRVTINSTGTMVNESGERVLAVNTRLLHYMKMSLDDQLRVSRSPDLSGVGPMQRRQLAERKNELLQIIERQNKPYRLARETYAGDSSLLDALSRGRDFFKTKDVDELKFDLEKMSRSERDSFRLGVMNALIDRIETASDTSNIANRLIGTTRNRDLIRATFNPGEKGTEAFNTFINRLEKEIQMKVTSNAMKNSATAARQEAINKLRKDALEPLPKIGNLFELVQAAMGKANLDIGEQQLQAAAKQITNLLTTTDRQTTVDILKDLESPSRLKALLRELVPSAVKTIVNPVTSGSAGSSTATNVQQNF